MNITIVGAGRVGGSLGVRWARAGHQVRFASRDPRAEHVLRRVAESEGAAVAGPWQGSADGADVVVLAGPWSATREVLVALGDLEGKTLVDCINPLRADFTGLELGVDTSAAEQIAEWAPGARVVKAFNTASAAVMENADFGDRKPAVFYCGDDDQAKRQVAGLAEQLGFEPIDAGPLTSARYIEPAAMLLIQVAIKNRWGGDCAFSVLRR